MALLCTLHADGPKTLRILREAGCTTIEKLRGLESNRLARLLSLSPAAARRLLREAALLEERLEPPLEREEVMYPPATSAGAVKPAPPGYLHITQAEDSLERVARSRAELDLRDRNLLDRVVARWRKADQRAREDPGAGAAPEMEAVPEPEVGPEPEPRTSPTAAAAEPLEVPMPGRRGQLHPGQLGGLDPETCARLARGGISSLEELATCPVDDLVARTKLSFTRARTLQFLAGRRVSEQAKGRGPAEPEPDSLVERAPPPAVESLSEDAAEQRISISPGRSSPGEEGAGGPFA